jgi:hypothetical protein
MARHIRLYDTNHPITAGTYGWFLSPGDRERNPIIYTPNRIQEVWNNTDFASIHWYQHLFYPDGNFDGALAATQNSGMPIVLEEIGQADDGYDNCSTHHFYNEAWVNTWTSQWTNVANSRGISGALVWANYDFNPDIGGAPGRLNCGQNPNPIFNGNYYGLYNADDSLKTTGVTFRLNAFSPNCSRASLRTWDGTHYLKAETASPRWVSAAATSANRTLFTVVPHQAGGYYFGLRSPEGYYMSADNGGGGGIHVDKTYLSWYESWGLVPIQRLNSSQWKVALHASNNQYVSAGNGGGGPVDANRTWIREWETFVMTCE